MTPAPALAQLPFVAEEVHTASLQLAALASDLEVWQHEMEDDLTSLVLKMAEWSRTISAACQELAL